MCWLYFLGLCPTLLFAQDGRYDLGARNHALSGTSITITDPWSIFNNPGALGSVEQSALLVGYQNRFNIEGFHVTGGGAILHQKHVNLGVKYFRFGDQYFNQQVVGLVIANRFQMVSLGGGINVIQTHTEGVNTRRVWVGEFGGVVQILDQLVFGAHLFNFRNGALHPTTMKAGISFRPEKFLMINGEVEKQLDFSTRYKTGIEYQVIDRVYLRTGLHLQRAQPSDMVNGTYGFGLRPGNFSIDYALSHHDLGPIHEVSLSYELSRPR